MKKKELVFFKMKKIILLIFFLNCFYTFAQNNIDSLKNILRTTKEDTIKVNTLNTISKAYMTELSDYKTAKQYAEQALALAKQLNFKNGIAYSYYYIGNYYWRTGSNKIALNQYNKALTIFKAANYKTGIAIVSVNMGYVYNSQGNYSSALISLQNGIKIKQDLGDKSEIIGAYNGLAITYASQGKYPEAYTYFLKSLKEDNHDTGTTIMVYNNIGYMFSQQQKNNDALTYYFKALALAEKIDNRIGVTLININIGNIYYAQKKYEQALKYHSKGLQVSLQTGEKTNTALAYTGIGLVYGAQKKYNEAITYQLKALKIQNTMANKEDATATSIALGNTYEKKGNDAKAIEYYLKALALSKSIGLKEGIKNAYKNLAGVYTKIKDYENALHFNNLYYEQKDSILSGDVLKQVAELNTKYETDKKEKEIQLLTKDQQLNAKTLKEQKIVRLALIIGLALLAILLFSVYKRYRFKQKANLLLEKQKKEIQQQNALITDSIDYAKTIQEVLLPTDINVKTFFPQSFILFKPKDIVSGDFYWVKEKNNKIICIAADCTGHGVPGAFMSLLGINMLDNITNREKPIAANILTALNEEITTTMSQQNTNARNGKHGMDVAILIIDKTIMQAQYAGAHNALYHIRDNKLAEIKADKISIGAATENKGAAFTNHIFDIRKEDVFYLFTDGFPDQIGGPNKKKFYYSPFKALLVSIHLLDMNEQKNTLDKTITEWRGEREQMDDVLIVGIKI